MERKADDGKSLGTIYCIPLTDRADLPAELILYYLLDTPGLGISIDLKTLETEPDMPCAVFAMNRAGLLQKIDQLTNRYPNMFIYRDQAGVRELQFKEKPTDKFQILRDYYASTLV